MVNEHTIMDGVFRTLQFSYQMLPNNFFLFAHERECVQQHQKALHFGGGRQTYFFAWAK
jgi:hypothetical protein